MSDVKKKNVLLTVVVTVITSVVTSYVTYQLVDKQKRHDAFVFENRKQLFEQASKHLRGLKQGYFDVLSALGAGGALTPRELREAYNSFDQKVLAYADYVDELRRLGEDEQIEVAQSILEWAVRDRAEVAIQLDMSESLQRRARELLTLKNGESELFEFVNDAYEKELLRLVQNENRVYYTLLSYHRPVIERLEQYLNLRFRQSLGLEATQATAQAIYTLPEAITRSQEFEYQAKSSPFIVADMREMMSADIKMSGGEELAEHKDRFLRDVAKMKFFSEAVREDSELEEDLAKRRDEHGAAAKEANQVMGPTR